MSDPWKADEPIREDNFINESERSVDPADDEYKVVKLEDDGKISGVFLRKKNVITFTEGGDYTPTAGTLFIDVEVVGAGGGGGGGAGYGTISGNFEPGSDGSSGGSSSFGDLTALGGLGGRGGKRDGNDSGRSGRNGLVSGNFGTGGNGYSTSQTTVTMPGTPGTGGEIKKEVIIIDSITVPVSVVVGSGGSGGSAGGSSGSGGNRTGANGGSGGNGVVIITEYF